jgi:hypothetical protein
MFSNTIFVIFYGIYSIPYLINDFLSIIFCILFIEIRLIVRLVMLSGKPLKLRLLKYKVKKTTITLPTVYG